jgi:hypothetical protein
MGPDVRTPIGLMIAIIGALLVATGVSAEPESYRRALGINLDLWWGLALLAVGLVMLALARRSR